MRYEVPELFVKTSIALIYFNKLVIIRMIVFLTDERSCELAGSVFIYKNLGKVLNVILFSLHLPELVKDVR